MALQVTLRQLHFLREVARHAGYTRAAEALHVSQPTVSAALREVERQAGLPLFEAVGRRVQLTEAGRVLHHHGERILAELADAERALSALKDGESGRLVIGASSTPGTYLLPALLGEFRRAHPRVDAFLEIGDTGEVLERVLAGRLDLGVVGETTFDPALHVELFRRETLVLIAPTGHPLLRRKRLLPRHLAEEPFILRERGSSTREVLERRLEARGVRPRVLMELGSTEAVKKTVGAGLGISFVSEHAVALEEQAGVLGTRRLPELGATRGLYAVWRRSLPPLPLHRRFLERLRASAARDTP